MTTASTSAVIVQANNANFNTWVQEVFTNLSTNCGLYQIPALMDTGQLAVPAAFAGTLTTNTAAGYYMFAFNDTLSKGPLSVTTLGGVATTTGSGYTNGAQTGMVVTGTISGANSARASGTVSGGAFGNLTITTAGTGYLLGEPLTVNDVTGTGAVWYSSRLTSAAFPCIIKLEFGASSATTSPMMWVTIGTSWTSNGTLGAASNGAVTTRSAVLNGNAPASTVTAYTSRYVYTTAVGSYLGMVFKIGGGGTNGAMGALIICRTSDASGNPTSDAVVSIANSVSATGNTSAGNAGGMQCMSYTGNTIYPTASSSNSAGWSAIGNAFSGNFIFGLTTTLENSTVFVTPIYTMDPAIRFSAYNGIAISTDFPIGNTALFAIVGSSTLTFISVGQCWGSSSGFAQVSFANLTFVMLWQ